MKPKNVLFTLLFAVLFCSCAVLSKNKHSKTTESSHLTQIDSSTNYTARKDSAANSLKIENSSESIKVEFEADSSRPKTDSNKQTIIVFAGDSIKITGAKVKAVTKKKSDAVIKKDSTTKSEVTEDKKNHVALVADTKSATQKNTSVPFGQIFLLFVILVLLFIFIKYKFRSL